MAELDQQIEDLQERKITAEARFEELDMQLADSQERHTQLDDRVIDAERALAQPGLAAQLAAASPAALMRGNESDLAALLESGDADAAWCYESLARALQIPYVRIGDAVDLGSVADSATYRLATVRIAGGRPGDSITVTGIPIRYAIAVLRNGPNVIGATMLRARLLDLASVRVMRRIGLDVLDVPRVVTTATPLDRPQ
jgi:ABC-type molybdate transport system substrate-binding protein